MASPSAMLAAMNVDQVGEWLTKLELPDTVIKNFHDNSVAGSDLATLSDDDLTKELGCTTLQARKIRRALSQWGIGGPSSASLASTSSGPVQETAPSAPPMPEPAAPAPVAAVQVAAAPAPAAAPAAPAASAAQAQAQARCAELEAALRALEGQAAEAGRAAATFGRGAQLLGCATAKLQDALKALSGTQAVGAFQTGQGLMRTALFGVPGRRQHDFAGNMIELATLRRANTDIAAAARETSEAAAMLGPGMPRVDERALGAARAGLFQNMLMGGAASDMVQMAMVRRSIDQTRDMLAQVQAAAAWANQNAAAHAQREQGVRMELSARAGELEAVRRQAAGM